VHGAAHAVVLGPVIRVGGHDDLGLLAVAQTETAVEREGLKLGLGGVPPGACLK